MSARGLAGSTADNEQEKGRVKQASVKRYFSSPCSVKNFQLMIMCMLAKKLLFADQAGGKLLSRSSIAPFGAQVLAREGPRLVPGGGGGGAVRCVRR